MKIYHRTFVISVISFACMSSAFAAKPIDLKHQPVSFLQPFMSKNLRLTAANDFTSLKELSHNQDFNQTNHIRAQETYLGYPVWGADAVIHLPNSKMNSLNKLSANPSARANMNGVFYQDLKSDLQNAPHYLFNETQAKKALQFAIKKYQSTLTEKNVISKKNASLMVYIDSTNKAHFAFLTRFFVTSKQTGASMPTFILDAETFDVYEEWNDLHTLENVKGGGVGGNEGLVGKLTYDGSQNHFPALDFQRDPDKKICYLRNALTIVNDVRIKNKIPQFACEKPDDEHNQVYWNTADDKNNGGYSPINDVIYSDKIVREMYRAWFSVDMLVKNNQPWQVTMHVHDPDQGQNAFYLDGEMTFGDGDDESYPVVAPSVVAHEMSHGFTSQHSDLIYRSQSGGLNESFSDMADKAVEYYVYGKNNWQIDPEVLKPGGRLLRWMDEPTRDCHGGKPGNGCSIDHMKDYNKNLNVHYSSGIYNKIFYLISTKWNNTKKAFEVMTQANMNYWTANTTFDEAACGVLKAAQDYKYDTDTINDAMHQVGVKTNNC